MTGGKLLIVVLLMCCSARGRSQTVTVDKISLSLRQVSFSELVKQIESRVSVHFYFTPAETDSLLFSLDCTDLPLGRALDMALSSSGLHYVMDESKHIFVSGTPLFAGPALASGTTPGPVRKRHRPFADSAFVAAKQQIKSPEDKRLYIIGSPALKPASGKANVAGFIRSSRTGEPVAGATVFIAGTNGGVSTDQYGYFILPATVGKHILTVQSIGMGESKKQIDLNSDGRINFDLEPRETTLRNVTVAGKTVNTVKSAQMGVQKLDIKTIKQVPVAFGEADLLRVLTTLPGVKTVGESSTGLNVRGGAADQNLILYNDATIFNPSHFFGLFSVFNPELVKDVELFKSSIPARYGGRLSSVMNINSREGNKKEFTGSAGIGLLTSRLDLEGPLVKDKTSFIIGGRTTYANWLLNLLPENYKHSRAGFYDVNLNISHEINKKNNLYLTAYLSKDHFNLNSDTTYQYGNQNLSLKWKHIFGSKQYMFLTAGYDRYDYSISSDQNPVNAYKLKFDVNQVYFKANFYYHLNEKHSLEYGLSSIHYKIDPGTYDPQNAQSIITPDTVAAERALESAIYVSDRYTVSEKLLVEAGLRYSVYNYLGPQEINQYAPGIPRTALGILGQQNYGKNNFIKTYSGPEYRVSVRYLISDSFSIKAGYNVQRQFIHVLSNTTAIAPTDIYKLSDPYIRPQYGNQFSLGLFKNFKDNTIEASVEVYYKMIEHYLDYKSGAELVLNKHIETDVLNTRGKAYGVEVQVKKNNGKLNGWVSYTYSRTLLKQDDALAGELVNKGDWYPANFDKPHDATLVSNYRVNHRFSVSLNANYSTGRPITLPYGVYYYSGSYRTIYTDRNAYRIPDYFRIDLGVNFEGNHRIKKLTHSFWTVGVYNLTGRRNPYSVYYVSQNGAVNGYRLSVFGSAIPYINYNVRF